MVFFVWWNFIYCYILCIIVTSSNLTASVTALEPFKLKNLIYEEFKEINLSHSSWNFLKIGLLSDSVPLKLRNIAKKPTAFLRWNFQHTYIRIFFLFFYMYNFLLFFHIFSYKGWYLRDDIFQKIILWL